jgi:hypothetical protein
MKQANKSKLLATICLAGMLMQASCCTKSGDPKNRSTVPWGGQGKSGTGALPGNMNEGR